MRLAGRGFSARGDPDDQGALARAVRQQRHPRPRRRLAARYLHGGPGTLYAMPLSCGTAYVSTLTGITAISGA